MCKIKTICYLTVLLISLSALPVLSAEKAQIDLSQKYIESLETQNKELKSQLKDMESRLNSLDKQQTVTSNDINNIDSRFQGYYNAMEDRIGNEFNRIQLIIGASAIILTIMGLVAAFLVKQITKNYIWELSENEYEKLSKLYQNTEKMSTVLQSQLSDVEDKMSSFDSDISKWTEKEKELSKYYNKLVSTVKTNKELSASEWLYKGNSLFADAKFEEAIEAYSKAINIKPDYHEAWNNKGIALRKLERYEEAIEAYDKAIEIKPDYHDAWYNKGIALGKLERYEEAIEAYDKAIVIKPDSHEAWNNKGGALDDLERYEEAIEAYNKAIEIKPDSHEAMNNKAWAMYLIRDKEDRLDEALELIKKALAYEPKNENYIDTKEKIEEAIKEMDKNKK